MFPEEATAISLQSTPNESKTSDGNCFKNTIKNIKIFFYRLLCQFIETKYL